MEVFFLIVIFCKWLPGVTRIRLWPPNITDVYVCASHVCKLRLHYSSFASLWKRRREAVSAVWCGQHPRWSLSLMASPPVPHTQPICHNLASEAPLHQVGFSLWWTLSTLVWSKSVEMIFYFFIFLIIFFTISSPLPRPVPLLLPFPFLLLSWPCAHNIRMNRTQTTRGEHTVGSGLHSSVWALPNTGDGHSSKWNMPSETVTDCLELSLDWIF